MKTHQFDDVPYDTDNEQAIANFWDGSPIMHKGKKVGIAGSKKSVSIKLSSEVIDYFKENSEDWQTKLDDTLKAYIADQQKKAA